MNQKQMIELLKQIIVLEFKNYEIDYRSFEEGDFGSLYQIEFNSDKIGGNVDFWELGWLGVFIWDYEKETEVYNILLEPQQQQEKFDAIEKLREIIRKNE